MTTQYRFVLLSVLLLVLVGCSSGAFGSFQLEVESVDDIEVVRSLSYFEAGEIGPSYNLSMTVPDSWAGQFETVKDGNSLSFTYVGENNQRSPILTIEALSSTQYWQQIGSYPGDYTNLVFTSDTYFVYTQARGSFYAGVSDEVYEELVAEVPTIVESFAAAPSE